MSRPDLVSPLLALPGASMRRMSLNRLLLIAVFIALLPTALLSIYLSFAVRNQARELITERLTASAAATAAMQRETLVPVDIALRELATLRPVASMTDGCSAALAASRGMLASVVNFGRIDARGVVRCSALPFNGTVNRSDTDWWQAGRASGRLTFSTPHLGPISRRQVIIAMLPLRTASGRFDGALTASIDTSWVERVLASPTASDQVVVALADAGGRVLLANRANTLPRVPMDTTSRIKTIADTADREWLYASAPVWGRQLHVVYAEPLMPLVAPITDQLRLSIALPLATIVLTCLAIWFAMYLFAERWLTRLRELIGQLSRGNYALDMGDFRAAPADIALLADDIFAMAQSVDQRDSALRSSAEARLALVGEVNHRVKNNLQMIMSLISLQASKISEPTAKVALNQMRMRIATLALIYRSLYEEEGESEQGNVDVDRLMAILAEQLRTSADVPAVRISVVSRIGIRPVDEVIPLAMFTVEVLTNALRHAFPAGRVGSIALTIVLNGGRTMLTIGDDGVGYSAADRQGEFGATLIKAYARQLGGTVTVDSTRDAGTSVVLDYPVRRPAANGEALSAQMA